MTTVDTYWEHYRIIEREGWLYLRSSFTLLVKPILFTKLWRVARRSHWSDDPLPPEGWAAHWRSDSGMVEVRRSEDPWAPVWKLGILSKEQKPDATEEAPVPRPKVRTGLETRWSMGRWEKRLKTGWVAA